MLCNNCGKEVPDNAKVCGYCGHRLKLVEIQIPTPISPHEMESKRKPSIWIWAVAGLGALLVIGIISAVVITKLVPNLNDQNQNYSETTPLVQPFSKPAHSGITIEPYNGETDIPKLYSTAEKTSPGTWTINISSNSPLIISWGWCAATAEILEQNLKYLVFEIIFDGNNVTSSMTRSKSTVGGFRCQNLNGIVRVWPVGQHTILTRSVSRQKINNGEVDFQGEEGRTYIINVTP